MTAPDRLSLLIERAEEIERQRRQVRKSMNDYDHEEIAAAMERHQRERLSARESDDKPAVDPAPTPGRKRQRDAVSAALLDKLGKLTAGKLRALEDDR